MGVTTKRRVEEGPKQQRVVNHLRALIRDGNLLAGDRLPAERDLAEELGITRGDVRRAVGYLAALGVFEVKHGVGAFLRDPAKALGSASLEALQMGSGFTPRQMFEARRALECELVGLAAERAGEACLVPISEALMEMYAATGDADAFLIHDIRFHRAIAQASGNPILATLMEVIAGALYEERQRAAGTRTNRLAALVLHRKIYHALRDHDPRTARELMKAHLESAEKATA